MIPSSAPLPAYCHTLCRSTYTGHKIPAIENLGVTKDQLDSIDFTDNSITSLSNFPLLRRLSHLLLANNPIRTLSPSLATSLPNLRTLIMSNSAMSKESLAALGDVLGKCKKLETVVLKGSPVEQADYYKDWVVYKCKKLRSLDFERVFEKAHLLFFLFLPFCSALLSHSGLTMACVWCVCRIALVPKLSSSPQMERQQLSLSPSRKPQQR